MDQTVERLIKEDEGFKETYMCHKDYERQLARLEKKRLLTTEENIEKNRLKKLKLKMKDRMEQALSRHRGS